MVALTAPGTIGLRVAQTQDELSNLTRRLAKAVLSFVDSLVSLRLHSGTLVQVRAHSAIRKTLENLPVCEACQTCASL